MRSASSDLRTSRELAVAVALLAVLTLPLTLPPPAAAQEGADGSNRIVTYKPQFLPPGEILDYLGARAAGGRGILEWQSGGLQHAVDLRANSAANLLILSGPPGDVTFVETMIRAADVAPRQIDIEVKIIEVSSSKARDVGIDWQNLIERSSVTLQTSLEDREQDATQTSRDVFSGGTTTEHRQESDQDTDNQYGTLSARVDLSTVLHVLDSNGALSMRRAPRILTLNNRKGTILDGSRVTYVTRYSSYANLYATDSLDAGLTLSVLPSLGESGFITLRITAEVTSLDGRIADSPVKTGQMLENTVVVKSGESVVLGGLTGYRENTVKRRFPLLGHVLPFLFSREISEHEEIRSFMILTPRVVDFASNLDEETRETLDRR